MQQTLSPTRERLGIGAPARRLLVLLAAAAAAQLISIELWVPAPRAHILWLPGAAAMSALLCSARRQWPAALAAMWLGAAGALVALQMPLLASLVLVGGNLLLVAAATTLLTSRRLPEPSLQRQRWVLAFALVGGIALPAIGAAWVVWAGPRLGVAAYFSSWGNIALSHCASYVLLVPAVLSGRNARARSSPQPRRPTAGIAVALALAVLLGSVSWMSYTHADTLRPFASLLSFVLLVATLLLFGTRSAFAALLVLSLTSMQVSSVAAAPLEVESSDAAVLAIQLWTVAIAMALLALVVLSEQRSGLRQALLRAYARLSDLTDRMLTVQEEERARIARELHDDISQSLAAISIQISRLRREGDVPFGARLAEIQQQVLEVSTSVRHLSHDLHPSILRYSSLSASLPALCQGYGAEDGLQVECLVEEDTALTDKQKINLFRVVQEALHNVQRHAHARHARVTLRQQQGTVLLAIEDDGIGLPDDVLQGMHEGLGMTSMQERSRHIGARFSAERRPGGGSRIAVAVPTPAPGSATRQ